MGAVPLGACRMSWSYCRSLTSSWTFSGAPVTVVPPPLPGGQNSINTRTNCSSTAASSVSGLCLATGGGQAGGGTGTGAATTSQDTYVANVARNAEFNTLQLRPQMRNLLQAHPPPANDTGNKFCVSWWGRGGCYSNCGCAVMHRRFASTTKRALLLTHVRAHLVVRPAGNCNRGK